MKLAGAAFAFVAPDGSVELWIDTYDRLARITPERIEFLWRIAEEMIGARLVLCSTAELADEVTLTIRRSRLVPGARELVVEGIDRRRRIVVELDVLAMLTRERWATRAA